MNKDFVELLVAFSKHIDNASVQADMNEKIDSILKVVSKILKSVSRSEQTESLLEEFSYLIKLSTDKLIEQGFSREEAIHIVCNIKNIKK